MHTKCHDILVLATCMLECNTFRKVAFYDDGEDVE